MMTYAVDSTPLPRSQRIAGVALSGLIVAFLLFGLYLGLIAWGGLYLRYEAVRRMIPLKR